MEEFNPLPDNLRNTKTVDGNNVIPVQPFGMRERMITTLLFDTQPKRKREWLKKLGYEENPKDDNQIKPINSPDDQYFPIDPGGIFNFKQYGDKGFHKGMSELGKDALEGALDMLQGTATEAAGLGGATIGTVGGPVGVVAGRSAGRMAMFNAIENMKDSLGNYFLEKDVPVDVALRATQTAIQAVAPEVMAKATGAVKTGIEKTLSSIGSGVRNLLNIGNGKIGKQAWGALRKNPAALADENTLRNASAGIDATVEQLIGGKSRSEANFGSSAYAKAMAPEEAKRKVQADILSQDPENSLSLSDVIKFFEQKKLELSDPEKYKIISQSREDGIKYISDKISKFKKDIPIGPDGNKIPTDQVKWNFGQIDTAVKELQDDLYSPKLLTKDWRNAVKSLVDGSPDSPGLNNILKDKATKAGSPYAGIKKKESEMFDAFEDASKYIDASKAKRFIVDDHFLDPKGTALDTTALDFTNALEKTDKVLGTGFKEMFRTGQINNQLWRSVESKGSGFNTLLPAIGVGSAVGGTASKLLGPEMGTAMGGAAALGVGALTNPKIGVPVAMGLENAASGLAKREFPSMASQIATQALNRGSTPEKISNASDNAVSSLEEMINPQKTQTTPEEFNPLNDFNPLKDFGK